MRLAMIPSSLLNQNFNVLKALFADYNAGGLESDRASALGRLGMAVGISFMIGPLIGTTFFSTYRQANLAALCFTLVAGVFLVLLPEPKIRTVENEKEV
jgi:MFS family permease